MTTLTLSLVEIFVLMLGAITLGITIHFFIVSRRNLKSGSIASSLEEHRESADWKLRYYSDIESRDKEINLLKADLAESRENATIYSVEAEEMRRQNKRLQAELEAGRKTHPESAKQNYMDQLQDARRTLIEQNDKIGYLISQIELAREEEAEQEDIRQTNARLKEELETLRTELNKRERELTQVKQKEQISQEMNSMLDRTVSEFTVLQDKIRKLESQVTQSKRMSMEFDDLQEEFYKISDDLEDQKQKYNVIFTQNQELRSSLAETEDKLREANFQRQQLQKKVAYLEELSNDLQVMTEVNKNLESQIRRVGELESLLQMLEEEKDELVRKQQEPKPGSNS